MGSVLIQKVTKQFGTRVVLNDISLELRTGEIAGLVGPNGAGKTTLFRLIAGQMDPDMGAVTASKGLEIGYLPQEPVVGTDTTLHDEVLGVFAEVLDLERKLHELSDKIAAKGEGSDLTDLLEQYDRTNTRFIAAGGYTFEQRLNEILGGLGFSPGDYGLPMSVLSGGQKCRAALAKLLLQDATYLLLDEPTNHLDIDAVRWLEKFLAGHQGGALIISHDRYLLDRTTERIYEMENASLRGYSGNYSTYARTRAIERLTARRQFEKDAAFIEKERDFIAKHLAGQRSNEAKGRRTRLERRLGAGEFVLDAPAERRRVRFDFAGTEQRDGELLRVDNLSKSFPDKKLFSELTFRLTGSMRLGITGPNGTGKSTLLKILLDLLPADCGEIQIASKVSFGYFAQEPEELDPDRTIVDEIRAAHGRLGEEQARSLLGAFLFRGDDVFKRLGQLSGGEQSRVRLIKLILSSPNVLILDEPTNHLDIPSREALEEALDEFPGALLAVSHDRYFLDRIADHLLVMRPEGVTFHRGNYSSYIEERERQRSLEVDVNSVGTHSSRSITKDASPSKKPRRTARYDTHTIEQLEVLVKEREQSIHEMNLRFGDPGVYRDPTALERLRDELEAARNDLAELEEAWLERHP